MTTGFAANSVSKRYLAKAREDTPFGTGWRPKSLRLILCPQTISLIEECPAPGHLPALDFDVFVKGHPAIVLTLLIFTFHTDSDLSTSKSIKALVTP